MSPLPPLYGLVLAGGRGVRLGRDKGSVDYHGQPQGRWAVELLGNVCERCFLSIRADQAEAPWYRGLPAIVDAEESGGPAGGLKAALQRFPLAAWLVLAVDMPLLDAAALGALVRARDPAGLATAYRHGDGTPEPLCAIWEPAVANTLEARGPAANVSLRRLLETGPAKLVAVIDEACLASANRPEDDGRIRRLLAERQAAPGGRP